MLSRHARRRPRSRQSRSDRDTRYRKGGRPDYCRSCRPYSLSPGPRNAGCVVHRRRARALHLSGRSAREPGDVCAGKMRLPRPEAHSTFMNSNPVDPIAIAIQEDIGEGDVTTEFFVPAGLRASAQIIVREKAIIAGTETAAEVFHRVDPEIRARVIRANSSEVEAGATVHAIAR